MVDKVSEFCPLRHDIRTHRNAMIINFSRYRNPIYAFLRVKPSFADHPSELVTKGFCNIFAGNDAEPINPEDAPGMSEAVDWTNSDACCCTLDDLSD